SVLAGMMQTKMVTCTARGGMVTFLDAALSGDRMFQLATVPGMMVLSDGQSITFEVQFNPSGMPATASGTIKVDFTSSVGPGSTTIDVTGAVTMLPIGTLICMPSPVAFGTVLPGMTPSTQVVCMAHGGAVAFTSARLSGDPMFH